MLLLFVLVISNNITKVEAAANDTTMISRVFEDVFAIQKYSTGGSRIYEALVYNMMKNGKIDIGYCIQIGQKIGTTNYSSTNDYTKFGIDKKTSDYIRLVAYYGYNYPNHADYKYFLAAQELIWEKLVDDEIYWTIGASVDGTKVDVESQKKEIETLVNNHYLKPEFTNKTINYKEKITLEDKNKILSEYKITSITNATYTISGNNLIITPTSLDDVTITLKRNLK